MTLRACLFHPVVAAFSTAILTIGFTVPGMAQVSPPALSPPGTVPRPEAPADAAAPGTAPAPDAAGMDRLFAELAANPDDDEDESWRRAESDILRAWSRSGSATIDLLRRRGIAALDEGDVPTAIGHLTALTDHAPDYAPGFVDRAAAYAMAGHYGPAAADLQRALTLEPRNFLALTQLGAMLEDMGDLPRAMAAFEASLKIHPHQPEARDAMTRLSSDLDGTAL